MSKKYKQPGQSQGGTSFTPWDGASTKAAVKEVGSEPVANRATMPVLFIAALGAALFWGDMYLVDHGGQLDARVYAPYRSIEELSGYQPKDEAELLKAKGQKIYTTYCAACHQPDGNGSSSQNVPPLAGSEWVLARDPARIIRVVLNGLQGPITVKGKEWGLGVMVGWRGDLHDDGDVAAVLTYVRNSWGNKAPAVKAEDVKPIREVTKEKGGNWTPAELLALPLKE